MTKFILILFSVYALFAVNMTYSANYADTSFSFKYYDYDVNINTSSSDFFTGQFNLSRNGKVLFSMDSMFSDYVEHRFYDLNSDGSNELMVYLTDGASPYIFHNLFIFDSKRDVKPLFMLQNGDLDTSHKQNPKLVVNSRMSPSVLGLWYSWYLEYSNGKLVYIKPDAKRKAQLRPDYEYVNEALGDLKKNNQVCDDFAYNVFFEYIFICSKISDDETAAENYFNENYLCAEKMKALKQFKKTASDIYSWIKEEENYQYFEH